MAEWDRLHAWLSATYPAAHAAMTRTILPNRTLIYHWPGSDAALAPIIVMAHQDVVPVTAGRSEEHTSELQSLMRISYAVFCLKKKTQTADSDNYKKIQLPPPPSPHSTDPQTQA